jgi:hypothetical protein
MVVHTCNRCKTEFHKKSHYVCHINRKIPCKEKVEVIVANPPENDIDEIILNINPPEIICGYCNQTFKRKDYLKKHLDLRCKVKIEKDKNDNILLQKILELEEKNKQMEEKNKQIEEKSKQMEEKSKQMEEKINILESKKPKKNNTNIINNNNINITNTTTNNITNIANFGTLDHKKINNKVFFNTLLKYSGLKPLIKFIEYVHKNEKMPEYQNVKITDLGRNLGQVFDNKVWVIEDANEITNKVIDETYNYYEIKFDQLEDEIKEKSQIEKLKIKRNKRFICCMRGSDMFDMNDDGDYVDDDGKKVSSTDFKNGQKFEDKLKKQVKMLLKV